MEDNEIEILKERFKSNFFQIEKRLVDCDDRLGSLEKNLKKLGEVENKIDKLEDIVKKDKKSEAIIIDETKQKVSESIKKLENLADEKLKIFEDRQAKSEKSLVEENKKILEKQDKKVNELFNTKSREIKEIEKNIGEKIERVEFLGTRLEETENLVKELERKSGELKIFREELDRDKNLYLELREVVIASVEKLKNFEKIFNKNLEEFGEINERVEASERLFEKLSKETDKEIERLDLERIAIEKNVEEFKNKLKERLTKRFEDLDLKLENEIKSKIKKQDGLLSSYGGMFIKLEEDMKKIENETIPRKIDMEFNEMLLVLNNKLKDLISKPDFDLLKAKIEHKIEEIRAPEMEPLKEKILAIEESIDELKNLLRGISQRLPVIVD